MNRQANVSHLASLMCCLQVVSIGQSFAGQSPLDELPPYIKRITHFGQRADWSHDGKRILFLSKTFGDAYEVELESGSNPVVSDDGRFIAFQYARLGDRAGVGRGIFVLDLKKREQTKKQ